MTNRETEILEVIRKNPMISQQELAGALGITRSSVAVHITNLQKKGYILGKGYIVREETHVTILGGANMDIQGFPKGDLILRDSNPGNMKMSLGGVGRNIGENLSKLGVHTKLITVLGNDVYGNKMLEEARMAGLDMQDSLIMGGQSTSTYVSILDGDGDMQVAIASMDIFDNMSVDFVKEKRHVFDSSRMCIIDTNIPREVIEYVVTNHKDTEFFLDCVSTSKARKIKDLIGYFHTVKPNKYEAELLTGIKIESDEDLRKASERLLEKGVKRVFITLGEDGVYYNDGTNENHIRGNKVKVVNATGAGDAFVAALAYAYLNHYEIDYSARFAMGASVLALSHENTINPNMSVDNVNLKMKETGLC